jgi:RNA polymerase-binding transcription factor DksA
MAKKSAAKKVAKPTKKAAKPAPKKSTKPAPKKAVKAAVSKSKKVAKPVAKKKASKPVAKKVTKPTKKAAKPAPKKSTKPAPKKVVKAVASKGKKVAKAAPKKVAKAKQAAKPVKAVPAKTVQKAAPAKVEVKKTNTKPAPKKSKPVSVPAKPVKKGMTKKQEKAAAKEAAKVAASKPLVTQVAFPNRPVAAPIVKKQVSTLEHASKLHYNDDELAEFKTLINRKLDEARKDYDLLKQTLANTDNNGTDDTSPSFKMIEDGSETLSREETAQLAGRQEKFIKHLEDALLRIRNKTYGICRVTGRLISKERLRLVPHATLSIEAKQQMGN